MADTGNTAEGKYIRMFKRHGQGRLDLVFKYSSCLAVLPY